MSESCPPPPPIVDNTAALAKVSAQFGTGPTCESSGGGGAFSFLTAFFGIGGKNSKGCSAISKQLSALAQSNQVATCQINRSASNSSQTAVLVQAIAVDITENGQFLCDSISFSNVSVANFRMSIQLDAAAQQSLAVEANSLVERLMTAKADSIEGYLATADGAQVFQAALDAVTNYITTTNVIDAYSSLLQVVDTRQTVKLTVSGILAGQSCAITNSNLSELTGAQLMQTLANQAASVSQVVALNESMDAYASQKTSGLDSVGGPGGLAAIIIAVACVLVLIIVLAVVCKGSVCKVQVDVKTQKNVEEIEMQDLSSKNK